MVAFRKAKSFLNCIIFRFGGNYHSAKPTIILAEQDYHSSEARLTIRYFLYAKHKEPGKQELICDIEVKGMRDDNGICERRAREHHYCRTEEVQSLWIYAGQTADACDEHQHAECRCEDSDEVKGEHTFECLKNGRNSGEYVDQADYASDLLVFAFCYGFIPSF